LVAAKTTDCGLHLTLPRLAAQYLSSQIGKSCSEKRLRLVLVEASSYLTAALKRSISKAG